MLPRGIASRHPSGRRAQNGRRYAARRRSGVLLLNNPISCNIKGLVTKIGYLARKWPAAALAIERTHKESEIAARARRGSCRPPTPTGLPSYCITVFAPQGPEYTTVSSTMLGELVTFMPMLCG